ncbi:hypothetical protein KVR01_000433 [Diaporthe batatas]|uniref:uncharacterized protein n=1 Tax=Diaporthe batatas TaxID=748121 RepID=UPI001D0580D5|nr:uncharacterized protein KVR01_000433 [Diaporthe batatas]KAG8169688.1 hypothetical protein KVR01_000433 [Diaporthe batatas]
MGSQMSGAPAPASSSAPASPGGSAPQPPCKKVKKAPGPARAASAWCARCVRHLEKDSTHRCHHQTGTGKRCAHCSHGNRTCTPIPFAVREPLQAFLRDGERERLMEAIRLLPAEGAVAAAAQVAPAAAPVVAEDEFMSLVRRGVVALEKLARETRALRVLREEQMEDKEDDEEE